MRVSVPCITPGAGPVRVRARRVQGKFPGTAVTVNARPWPVQPPSDTGGPTDPTTGPGTVPDSRLPLSDDAVQVTEAPLLVSASTQLPTSAPLNAPPGEIVHGGGIGGGGGDPAVGRGGGPAAAAAGGDRPRRRNRRADGRPGAGRGKRPGRRDRECGTRGSQGQAGRGGQGGDKSAQFRSLHEPSLLLLRSGYLNPDRRVPRSPHASSHAATHAIRR